MDKEIIFHTQAREKLAQGISAFKEALLADEEGINRCKDPYVQLGMGMARECVLRIKSQCSHDALLALQLLEMLVAKGCTLLNDNVDPNRLKQNLEEALILARKRLQEMAIPITTDAHILQVAQASSSGRLDIAHTILDAISHVGTSGVITVQEGQSSRTSVEMVQGMTFNSGYVSPYFCSDTKEMVAKLESVRILVTNQTLSSIHNELPLIQQVIERGESLLIIAHQIDGDALSTLVVNKLRGMLSVCAVKAPSNEHMEDIAILTKSIYLDTKETLKNASLKSLGFAASALVTKEQTTLSTSTKKERAITQHIRKLKKENGNSERIARLESGIAVICVGGGSSSEITQDAALIKSGLKTTQSTQKTGALLGNGMSLVFASSVLLERKEIGFDLLRHALCAPFNALAKSCKQDPQKLIEEIEKHPSPNAGFNADTGRIEDLYVSGVFTPLEVIDKALLSAVQTATEILLTGALMGPSSEGL